MYLLYMGLNIPYLLISVGLCKVVPQFVNAKLVYDSHFTMVYGRYVYTIPMVYKPTNIPGEASSCDPHIYQLA